MTQPDGGQPVVRLDKWLQVARAFKTTTAEARGMPLSTFAGIEATHFIPAVSKPSPRYPGRQMMRSAPPSGKRRNEEWGRELAPRVCAS